MKIENMLRLYPIIPQEIVRLNAELNELSKVINISYIRANAITGLPHGTDISDPTFKTLEHIETKTEEAKRKLESHAQHLLNTIDRYISIKECIDNAFLTMSKDERKVIELRYFDCIRWDWIPAKMHYSRTYCFALHNRAIKAIKSSMKKNKVKI